MHKRSRGFTLIELLLTLGLVAAISSIAMFATMRMYLQADTAGEADTVRMLLVRARAFAMAGVQGSSHGVCASAHAYVLFEGSPDRIELSLPRGVRAFVSGIDCATPVVFSARSGAAERRTISIDGGTGTTSIALYADGTISS